MAAQIPSGVSTGQKIDRRDPVQRCFEECLNDIPPEECERLQRILTMMNDELKKRYAPKIPQIAPP